MPSGKYCVWSLWYHPTGDSTQASSFGGAWLPDSATQQLLLCYQTSIKVQFKTGVLLYSKWWKYSSTAIQHATCILLWCDNGLRHISKTKPFQKRECVFKEALLQHTIGMFFKHDVTHKQQERTWSTAESQFVLTVALAGLAFFPLRFRISHKEQ